MYEHEAKALLHKHNIVVPKGFLIDKKVPALFIPCVVKAQVLFGKRAAETVCMDFSRQYKVDMRIARIFNTYGPNMSPDDGRVVSNFIMQALENMPITVYGTGAQTRSFCFVSDLVAGLIKLMNSDLVGPVNLGNPNECTILELAKEIVSLAKSSSTISEKSLPEDDPKKRNPDISIAKSRLHWEPKVGLKDGLSETIKYFKGLTKKI